MIAVAFPTDFEAHDFLAALNEKTSAGFPGVNCWIGKIRETQVLVVVTGIGGRKASETMAQVLTQTSVRLVILTGFAGALSQEMVKGQILVAARYSSKEMLDFLKIVSGYDIALMCTTDEVVATPQDKTALAARTGCQIVDMEMSHVAEVVARFGIEILGVRAISDTAEESVPADILSHSYDPATGLPTPFKMAIHCLLRPQRWKELKDFLTPLPAVRRQLTDFLIILIREFEEGN